ncbi:hypothetical protein AKJ09_11085 [Labilithrix luteola]|uniref:Uncharacterized protein n=1 Tax=Labilithrix luteola TaxID=1391654 RepID=A0A0K1QFJ4_9BACT|nr:hypothetical protein [Labilithrix luteola]AKV04422.1 hypothetical protein AKJ09_11085 [Labilithrix luteola]
MSSYVVLKLGTATLKKHAVPTHPDAADGYFALRSGRGVALLFLEASLDDLSSDDEEAAEELALHLTADLLAGHRDPRGVLVSSGNPKSEPRGKTYDQLVAELSPNGRWIPNEGAALIDVAGEDREIPVPPLPKAKPIEVYVLSPARAMRDLALQEAPLRVVCRTSRAKARPVDASTFYVPKMKALGFTTKRRVWSDGSAEELRGEKAGASLQVLAEQDGADAIFLRVTIILHR